MYGAHSLYLGMGRAAHHVMTWRILRGHVNTNFHILIIPLSRNAIVVVALGLFHLGLFLRRRLTDRTNILCAFSLRRLPRRFVCRD